MLKHPDLTLPLQPITPTRGPRSLSRLLLLAVMLAGCPTSGYAEQPSNMIAQVGYAKTANRVKAVEPGSTKRAPLGVKLLSEPMRNVVFQDRLRGLCELVKAERVSSGKWRASCADGGPFFIRVYPDGFMTVTRLQP